MEGREAHVGGASFEYWGIRKACNTEALRPGVIRIQVPNSRLVRTLVIPSDIYDPINVKVVIFLTFKRAIFSFSPLKLNSQVTVEF